MKNGPLSAFAIVSVVIAGGPTGVPRVGAQGPGPVGLRSELAEPPHSGFRYLATDVPSTQWKKGMLIGGAAGLALDLLIVWPMSQSNETGGSFNPLGFLPLIAVGALIGGLIGAAFRK